MPTTARLCLGYSEQVRPEAVTLDAILRSCDQLAFRHYDEPTVHLFTDCPAGKLIGIARREAVTETALEGLELCAWCHGKAALAPANKDDEYA